MKKISLFLILGFLVLLGCQMNTSKNGGESKEITITETVSDAEQELETIADSIDIIADENYENAEDESSEEYYEPSEDEIQEYGVISEIEDSAYPVFNITVEFPERQMQATFYLNIESISLDMESLYKLRGKYATIYYTSDEENDLYDMKLDGNSLFGEYAPEEDYSTNNIVGILSGAEAITMSDLPGKIYVTDKNGRQFLFEWYVDEMMVKANGKTVTAYFSTKYTNKITHIIPSEY